MPVEPLLDRLIERRSERGGTRARGDVRNLRDAVRLDLQNLLNTRWRFLGGQPEQGELRQSLINYGIPDFTGTPFADPGSQRQFCRVLEDAIRAFEPRLRMVKVTMRAGDAREDRVLRFRIEAMLTHGEISERAVFESVLDAGSSVFRVGLST